MSDQGKANYEGYRAAAMGKSLISGDPLPEWADLGHLTRLAWDAGACSVELWLAEAPVDEDAPGNEPKTAKVIVVTEVPVGDRAPVERRYSAAAEESADYGYLHLVRDGRRIARYQPMGWLSVRDEDATVPDSTARALGIAKRALEAVARISDPNVAIKLATDALDEIFTETEL